MTKVKYNERNHFSLLRRRYTLLLAFLLGFIPFSFGQLLLEENFDYTAGTLLTANGWTNVSGTSNFLTVVSPGLTYTGYASVTGNAVGMVTTGEDVKRMYTAQTGNTVYASFLVNVSASQITGEYFLHLTESAGSFKGRTFIKKDPTLSTFAFGVSAGSTVSSAVFTPFTYSNGTTYLLVLKYNLATNTASLFVDPTISNVEPTVTITSTDVATAVDIAAMGIRQGTAANAPTLTLDGIRVAASWAELFPATVTPAITLIPTTVPTFGDVMTYAVSAEQTFTVEGSDLTADIELVPPAAFEISLATGPDFAPANPLVLTQTGGTVASTTIHVRFRPIAIEAYSANIAATSGTANGTVAVSGNGVESNVTALQSIDPTEGSLNPPFNPTVFVYNMLLPAEATIVPMVIGTAQHPNATVTVQQATSITGTPAERTATLTVTAQDGTSVQAYTVTYTKEPYHDATLSNLTVSNGTLVPTFAAATLDYSVVLPYGETVVPIVTPTVNEPNATTQIVAATSLTGSLAERTTTVTVTAQDGTTTITYTVVFSTEAPSTDATLATLTVDAGTLVPVFEPAILSYSVVLPYTANAVPVVSATKNSAVANINIIQATSITGTLAECTATVTVTAQDGTTINVYAVVFSKELPSTDASLASLTVDAGTLVPVFEPATLSYTVVLPYTANAVPTVSATTNSLLAAMTIVQATNITGTLAECTATVTVTAQDATSNVYTVVFSKEAPSTDAHLATMVSSLGNLVPAFSENTFDYDVDLPMGTVNTPTLTVTTVHPGATPVITNAVDVNSLVEADRTSTIVVTAQDGSTELTYTVTFFVVQTLSSDATLSSLQTSMGVLDPVFEATTFGYGVALPYEVATVPTITATANHPSAAVLIAQATNLTGTDVERTATVTVTAQDGTTVNVYAVTFVKLPPSTDATLATLSTSEGTLNPAFEPTTLVYDVLLPFNASVVPTVSATANSPFATLGIAQAANLTGTIEERTATVRDVAQDRTTILIYTITFTREEPNHDAHLSSLTLSEGTLNPVFNTSTYVYQVLLPNATTTVPTVSATAEFAGATVDIAQASALTGSLTDRTATVTVTAQDGSTVLVYSIVFERELNHNANLATLTVSEGTLNPAFAFDVYVYNVLLPNTATEVPNVMATPEFVDATMQIVPASAIVGTLTQRTATVTVTAQDGTTVLVYSVIFEKEPSHDAHLSNLALTEGVLDPSFMSEVFAYQVTLPYSATVIPTVSATPVSADASLLIEQASALEGQVAQRTATVTVTAQDNSTVLVYTVTFAKAVPTLAITAPANDATIPTANLDIAFLATNFVIGDPGAGIDGHIHYTLDGGTPVMYYTTNPIQLTGLTNGTHAVTLELVDNNHNALVPAVSATVNFTVALTPVVSIHDIQFTTDPSGDSPYKDQVIATTGIVTAVKNAHSYFIQSAGAPEWNGVYVYDPSHTPAVGDIINITALCVEYFNLTELKTVTAFTIVSSGNEFPPAAVVNAITLATEPYEGVLVEIQNATCTNVSLGNNEWELTDASGVTRADDLFYAFTPTLNHQYNVKGTVNYGFNFFKVEPRDANDIVDVTPISNEANMISFVLTDETHPAVIDVANHTVAAEIIAGASLTALTPTVTVSNGATVVPASGSVVDFTAPVTYTVTAEAGNTQDWTVTVTNAATLSTENDILTFEIAGQVGTTTIDQVVNTIAVVMPYNVALTAIAPSITVSTAATVAPESGVTVDFSLGTVNYTVTAQAGNTQIYVVSVTNAPEPQADLIISEYIEGNGSNKALEIYNGLSTPVDMSQYVVKASNNGSGWGSVGGVADTRYVLPLTGILAPGEVFVAYNSDAVLPEIIAAGDLALTYNATANGCEGCNVLSFSGDDAIGLFKNDILIDVIGLESPDPGAGWAIAGIADATKDHTIHRKIEVTMGSTDWATSAGTTAENSEWIVEAVDVVSFIGWHGIPANQAPAITNVSIAPLQPVANEVVVVSATVTDDAGLATVNLLWSLDASYSNTIAMTLTTNDVYTATIPAQTYGVTVMYKIVATDNDATPITTEHLGSYIIPTQGNTPPVIGTLVVTPAAPATGEAITVSTEITDNGTVANATLHFGTTTAYGTTVPMTAAGNIFTGVIPAQTVAGTLYIKVVAADNEGIEASAETTVVLIQPTVTIYQIQYTTDATGDSPYKGQVVTTTGIVTAVKAANSYFIQDGAGEWNGVYVFDNAHTPAVGDLITITCLVSEYYNLTELKTVTAYNVVSSGNPLPTPSVINALAINSEAYEGVYVKIEGANCTNISLGNGEWELTDASGVTRADDLFFAFTPTLGNQYNVTGVVNFGFSFFKIEPRSADDIVDVSLPNVEADILTFELTQQTGPAVIDATAKTVTIEVLAGSPMSALAPTITISQDATINPASGAVVDFSAGAVIYTVTAEAENTQDWTVTVTEATTLSTENDLLTFVVNGQIGNSVIDQTAYTVSVLMPYNVAINALAPVVTISLGATVVPASGTTVDFSQGVVTYTVTAQDPAYVQPYAVTVTNAPEPTSDLFFSEYIEGSSNNKALEIYNGSSQPINLSQYTVNGVSNGGGDWSSAVFQFPNKVLAAGEVYVIAANTASAEILAVADTTLAYEVNKIPFYNGDDARAIFKGGVIIDIFGVESPDPGEGWAVAGVPNATKDHTIVRKDAVTIGNTDWVASAGTTAENSEWIVYPIDDFTHIGHHPDVFIPNTETEILSFSLPEQTGAAVIDTLLNTVTLEVLFGTPLTALAPVITVSEGASIVPASGATVDFSLGAVTYTVTSEDLLHVALWSVTVTAAQGQSTANDILSFEIAQQIGTSVINTTEHTVTVEMPFNITINALAPTLTVSAGASVVPASGATVDFSQGAVTYTVTAQDPTAIQAWTVTVTNAAAPTLVSIHDIQYTTDPSGDSPYKDQIVYTKGLVTAVVATKGYYIQDGDGLWDGIYVFDNTHPVATGDSIAFKALAVEYFNLTELKTVTDFVVINSGNTLPTPVTVNATEMLESIEGVLLRLENFKCVNVDFDGHRNALFVNEASLTDTLMVHSQMTYPWKPKLSTTYTFVGLGNYDYSNFKLEPRDTLNDIIVLNTVNNPPVIENVVVDPAEPHTGSTFVVLADITDDVAVTEKHFFWGTSATGITNELTLSPVGFEGIRFRATVPAQTEAVTVYYKFTATDGEFLIVDSGSVSVTVGIGEIAMANVSIYPNPVSNMVTFNNIENVNRIAITTTMGTMVNTFNNLSTNKLQVNVSNLNNGIYFVTFYTVDGYAVTRKVVKK